VRQKKEMYVNKLKEVFMINIFKSRVPQGTTA